MGNEQGVPSKDSGPSQPRRSSALVNAAALSADPALIVGPRRPFSSLALVTGPTGALVTTGTLNIILILYHIVMMQLPLEEGRSRFGGYLISSTETLSSSSRRYAFTHLRLFLARFLSM